MRRAQKGAQARARGTRGLSSRVLGVQLEQCQKRAQHALYAQNENQHSAALLVAPPSEPPPARLCLSVVRVCPRSASQMRCLPPADAPRRRWSRPCAPHAAAAAGSSEATPAPASKQLVAGALHSRNIAGSTSGGGGQMSYLQAVPHICQPPAAPTLALRAAAVLLSI